jgi:hypothetical protein
MKDDTDLSFPRSLMVDERQRERVLVLARFLSKYGKTIITITIDIPFTHTTKQNSTVNDSGKKGSWSKCETDTKTDFDRYAMLRNKTVQIQNNKFRILFDLYRYVFFGKHDRIESGCQVIATDRSNLITEKIPKQKQAKKRQEEYQSQVIDELTTAISTHNSKTNILSQNNRPKQWR